MNVIISVEKKINPLNTFGRLWDSGVQVLKIFDLVRLILCFCDDATAFDLFSAAPDLLSQNRTQYLRKNRSFDRKTIRIRNQTADRSDQVFCYSLDESDVTDSLKLLKLFRDHYYFNLHKNQERKDHGPNGGNEHLNTESGKSKIFWPKLVALFLELHIQKELKKITLSLPNNKDVNLFRIAGNAFLQQQIINNARVFVEKNYKSTLFPSDDADAVSLIKSFEDDVWEGKWFQHICGLQITSKNKVAANVLFALGLQEIEVQKLYQQQQQQKHLQSTDEKSISFESHLRKLRIGHFDSGALDCFQYYSFLHLQELRLTRIRFEHVLELARLYDDCVPKLSKLFMVICVDIPESKDESSGSSSDDDSEYDYADDDASKNEEQSGKYVVDQFNKGDDEHDQKYECHQNDKQVPNDCKTICFPNSLQHLSVAFDLGQQFQHSEETETENNVFITHIRPTIIHSICSLNKF